MACAATAESIENDMQRSASDQTSDDSCADDTVDTLMFGIIGLFCALSLCVHVVSCVVWSGHKRSSASAAALIAEASCAESEASSKESDPLETPTSPRLRLPPLKPRLRLPHLHLHSSHSRRERSSTPPRAGKYKAPFLDASPRDTGSYSKTRAPALRPPRLGRMDRSSTPPRRKAERPSGMRSHLVIDPRTQAAFNEVTHNSLLLRTAVA